jgi:hypothetical protein
MASNSGNSRETRHVARDCRPVSFSVPGDTKTGYNLATAVYPKDERRLWPFSTLPVLCLWGGHWYGAVAVWWCGGLLGERPSPSVFRCLPASSYTAAARVVMACRGLQPTARLGTGVKTLWGANGKLSLGLGWVGRLDPVGVLGGLGGREETALGLACLLPLAVLSGMTREVQQNGATRLTGVIDLSLNWRNAANMPGWAIRNQAGWNPEWLHRRRMHCPAAIRCSSTDASLCFQLLRWVATKCSRRTTHTHAHTKNLANTQQGRRLGRHHLGRLSSQPAVLMGKFPQFPCTVAFGRDAHAAAGRSGRAGLHLLLPFSCSRASFPTG